MNISKKVISAILAGVMTAGLLAGCSKTEAPKETEFDLGWEVAENEAQATTAPTQAKELSVTDLLKAVLTVKDDLETAIEDLEEDNIDEAKAKVDGVPQKTDTIRLSLDMTLQNLGDSMPSLKTQLENIQQVLNLVDMAAENILKPMLNQVEAHPIKNMKVEDGISTKELCNYIDFAETLMPSIEDLVELANTVDLSVVDSDGDMEEYLEKANSMLETYQTDNAVFDRMKSMLGGNGDRLYVVAAQNSAEIRASGGFPGAIGTIRIEDGILTLGDFKKVYDVLSSYTPAAAKVTSEEGTLFHGGLSAPRDADYCPDFERVAYIWALGYEAEQGEHVDGVISMTPALVQRMLEAIDEEIKLFDGTELTGKNAVRSLQYDLYYKYFTNGQYVANREIVIDQLFADAAKKTAQKLMENLEMSDLMAYLSIASDSFEDRTMMLWMKDEQEQELLRKLNWHAGLNADPEKPQAGIYYNCTVASKMGWFFEMDTEIGERTKNEDGSYTYPMTVTFHNIITNSEYNKANHYITGGSKNIGGSAYFFAPAGGTVSDFVTSNGMTIRETTYNDHPLGFMQIFNIYPGEPVTITYNVTTAPGVDAELELSLTPTLEEYH